MKPLKHHCELARDLCVDKCKTQCALCMLYDGGEYSQEFKEFRTKQKEDE